MGEEGGSWVQLGVAASLVIGAFLVVLTCTWKLVRLLAMYKMESQIEVGTYQFGCGILKMVGPKKQVFWQKINILKGNHCILRIRGAPVRQKLGMILENRVV